MLGRESRPVHIGIPILGCLLALAGAPAGAPEARDPLDRRIHEILAASHLQPGEPGLAVLVRRDGQTVFARGYGVTRLRSPAKIGAHTNFRLASVSKQFTAMAVMLLVHDQKLGYDWPLTRIFPGFPSYGDSITVRNLLNHTSGLPDYEELMEKAEKTGGSAIWSPARQIRDREVLALLGKTGGPKFPPGTRWSYSNSGYVLLGLVVEKISGKPFPDFLRERIFAPLLMAHTLAYVPGRNRISNRAMGHLATASRGSTVFEQRDQSATSATLGDGGVYSNLEDLARWDEALTSHTLMSEAEMQPALTPVGIPAGGSELPEDAPASLAGKAVSYGFGWFLDPYRGHGRMWHYGDTMGFKSAIVRFPDDRLTILVLANRTDLDPGSLADKIADQCFPPSR